jgi:hypothetical protein
MMVTHQQTEEMQTFKDADQTKEMRTLGYKHQTDKITYHGYDRFYVSALQQWKNSNVPFEMLEIGIGDGCSARMWLEYFPNVKLTGFDRYQAPPSVTTLPRFTFLKGDLTNLSDLKRIKSQYDVIIDDASHHPDHQLLLFNSLFVSNLNEGGLWIIEDINTSYWRNKALFGYEIRCGFGHPKSIVEIFKQCVDDVNRDFLDSKSQTTRERQQKVNPWVNEGARTWIASIQFVHNAILIRKQTSVFLQTYYGRQDQNKNENETPKSEQKETKLPVKAIQTLEVIPVILDGTELKGGYNMCLVPEWNGNGFVATVRLSKCLIRESNDDKHFSVRTYPEIQNECWIVHFDHQFRIVRYSKLVEKQSTRIKHRSFTSGLEDCRLIVQSNGIAQLFAITLDTNNRWLTEMSCCEISLAKSQHEIPVPMVYEELNIDTNQKNWIPLRCWGYECHFLQQCNPWRVIRMNTKTGKGTVLLELKDGGLCNFEAHAAASVRLSDNQFLITVREYCEGKYIQSRWILIDDTYTPVKLSKPFRFQTELSYEMCMSLSLSSLPITTIIACVSLDDKAIQIHRFSLSAILETFV